MGPVESEPELGMFLEGGAARALSPYLDIPAAPIAAVLVEQLEYLIEHRKNTAYCAPSCRDCKRLADVSAVLLLPFGRLSE